MDICVRIRMRESEYVRVSKTLSCPQLRGLSLHETFFMIYPRNHFSSGIVCKNLNLHVPIVSAASRFRERPIFLDYVKSSGFGKGAYDSKSRQVTCPAQELVTMGGCSTQKNISQTYEKPTTNGHHLKIYPFA